MPEPHTANAGGRYEDPSSPELITYPLLAQGRVLKGELQNRRLDIFRYAILEVRNTLGLLYEGFHSSLLVRILHPVKRVPAVAHHSACLGDVFQVAG